MAPPQGLARALAREPDGRWRVDAECGVFVASYLILATGVRDRLPPVEDAISYVREGKIRQCPICDGYEVIDRRIAVLGSDRNAAGEALFLRTYTADVTLVTLGMRVELGDEDRRRLDAAGVRIVETPVRRLVCDRGGVEAHLESGVTLEFYAAYSGLGIEPNTDLSKMIGVELTSEGRFLTDAKQRTSQPGVYAAGDAVTGLNQIAVATAQAEVATVDIHNDLRRVEGITLCE